MLFDAHTHLNHDGFSQEERNKRMEEIDGNKRLMGVVDVGFDLESSALAAKHAGRYPWCYGAVGFHPHSAKEMGAMELGMIESLAKKPGVKAIGEIGLDFHYDHSPREEQRKAFRAQIALANKLKMPMVIHAREADQEVMDILKEEGAFSSNRKAQFPLRKVPPGWESGAQDARVMLHCYSGSKELAEQYVRLGGTISIAGPVTYKNNRKTVQVVQAIPTVFLLAETDAPFLAPVPFRGKPNYSHYVEHTIRRISVIKEAEESLLQKQLWENGQRFFNL